MRRSVRLAAIGLVISLVSAALPGAAADGAIGIARAKNVASSTVTIDERVYRVLSSTAIRDAEGRHIALADVPTSSGNLLESQQMVRFVAVESAGAPPVLQRLDLIEVPR